MKRLVCVFGVVLFLAGTALAQEYPVFARVTVYWASGGGGSDACTRQHKCATGARLRAGHCAVDPKKIPYGSKVLFPDMDCVAVDTGSDVISRTAARRSGRTSAERSALVIDRFFETKGQALSWARSHPHFMTVRILTPREQSPEKQSFSAIAKQNAQATPGSVAQSGLVDVPQNLLVADNNKQRGWQLPRRF